MVRNTEVAERLSEIADLLDLLGERFKPEAYRRAARSLEALPEPLEAIAGRGELRSIPGVGEAIADKVSEILRTGSLAYLDKLRAEVPVGVLALMRLPGVGPKTARRFWTELGIEGPHELAVAIDAGRLAGVKGFAEKKIAQLRAAAEAAQGPSAPARVPLEEVWPLAHRIVEAMRAVATVREVALAGSFRRSRETVGDLDVLVTAEQPEGVFDAFSALPIVREVRLRGPTKETVVLTQGLQVDLRVVEPEAFGAALQYFTGSKDHNVRLRSLARDLGLKVNEYGVYRGEERIAGRTEEEVYAALGVRWIPPELREDRGEVAAAQAGSLPRLVEAADLRAEGHLHLPASLGLPELERLLSAARERSLETVAVVAVVLTAGGRDEPLPAELLGRLPRSSPPRVVPLIEVRGAPAPAVARELAAWPGARLVVVPSLGEAGEDPTGPDALFAHVGGTAEEARPVLDRARAAGAAVEVGPGPDRFDSTVARLAVERGVPLSLPTGVGRPDDDPLAPVALGFARRAGATAAAVANARAERPAGAEPPAGLPKPPARRRR